ncbi:MAG TPA: phage holin family protein [Chitinophagales bacterium]|nr:phage holin family protein [Chitinophagales bacterium]
MEDAPNAFEELYARGEAYTKTSIELAKLKALEAATQIVTTMIWRLSVIVTLSLFALVFNIGVALWLGEVLGKSYYGFFIVAGFYLLTGVVLHFFLRSWIKKPVSDLIITQALQ